MSATRSTATRAALLFALLLTWSGCNALAPAEDACAQDSDCPIREECDGAGFCRLAADARACNPGNEAFVCGEMGRCVEDGHCVPDDPVLVLLNAPLTGDDAERARVQTATLRMVEQELSQELLTFEGRSLRIEHLLSEGTASARVETFRKASALGADVIVVFDTDTLVEAQRYFRGTKTLILGQFSNDAAFGTQEFPAERAAFGLIPQPRADFAMWSKHLRDTGLCESVAAVYLAGSAAANTVVFLDEQIGRHGLDRAGLFILESQSDPGAVITRLESSGADCAFLFPVVNEEPASTMASFLTTWDAGANRPPMRWLFVSQTRYEEMKRTLPGQAFNQLSGAIAVNYEVGQERGARVLERLERFYTNYTPAPLSAGTPEKLPWEQVEDLRAFVSLSYDQGVLAVLAIYRALERAEGGPVRRGDVLEGFLAVNGGAQVEVACDSDAVGECLEALNVDAEAKYSGASGALQFGEDGRTVTVDETMSFYFGDFNQELVEEARYSQEDMARALATSTPRQ